MDLTSSLGLETIQRAAILVLFEGLNDKIDELEPDWSSKDDLFWTSLNRGTTEWAVEKIEDENFYAGHIPSLIEAPIEKYPNVAAIAYSTAPKRSNDGEGENYTMTLAIEIMVKSEFSEEQVNSRIQKTVDAAHRTILDDMTIGNAVSSVLPPAVTIGDVFIRRERRGQGDRWFWQGGALTYTLDKFVLLQN